MFEKISVIVNPISGRRKNKKELLNYVWEFFSKNGTQVTMKQTSRRGEATDLAQEATAEKDDLVVVIGGDGTVNEVCSGLVGSQVAMGIIPLGSGNGLARTLNIPQNVEKACKLISECQVVEIDAGKANDRIFVSIAGVGFDAAVGKRFDEYKKRGPVSYFYVGVKEFFLYEPEEVKISFDDQLLDIKPFVIAVANGQQYGNNAIIAPDAKINDGLLDITIIRHVDLFEVFSALPRLFSGNLRRYQGAEFYRAKRVRIERNGSALVNIDGEAFVDKPVVEISILPKSLKIIAPLNSPCLSYLN